MAGNQRHAVLRWGIFVCLIVLQVSLVLGRDRPLIFADEAGYLGNARYLAGGLPIRMFNAGAYYPGYSVLLVPIFWLGLSPEATYQAVLILNAVLLSTLYISLAAWLRTVLGEDSPIAHGIALVAALYPAFLAQGGFAMSESAVIALHAALPLVVFWFVRSKRATFGLLFALMSAFLYAIHPRFVGTVAAAALIVLAIGATRQVRSSVTLLTLAALGTGTFAARAFTSFVARVNGGGQINGETRASLLSSLSGLWSILIEVLGQLWYLQVASAGLVLLGGVALAQRAFSAPPGEPKARFNDPAWYAVVFLLLSTCAAVAISSIFMAPNKRVDHMIYGRYNEGVIAPVIAAGALWLVRTRRWQRWSAFSAFVAITLLGGAAFLSWSRGEALSGRPNLANILGLITPLWLASGMAPLKLGGLALALFFSVGLLARWRAIPALCLLGGAYLTSGVLGSRYFRGMQEGREKRTAFLPKAEELRDVRNISYDASAGDSTLLFYAQYFYPQAAFDFFTSKNGDEPKSSVVLAQSEWVPRKPLLATPVAKSKSHTLWSVDVCCEAGDRSFSVYGARAVKDVTERGFHQDETWDRKPVRWTDGDAELWLPAGPGRLEDRYVFVDLARVGRRDGMLTILANERQLFHGELSEGRLRVLLPLRSVPTADTLRLRIKSATFVPATDGRSKDGRALGVAVAGIRLVNECCIPDWMSAPPQ